MRQKAALFLAVLMALEMPVTSAARVRYTLPIIETPASGDEDKMPDAAAETVEDDTDPATVAEETEPGAGPEGEPSAESVAEPDKDADESTDPDEEIAAATASEAQSLFGMRRIILEKTGSLKIDIQGVVASRPSVWQAELYPSGTVSAEEGQISQLSSTIELPGTEDGVYVNASAVLEEIPSGVYDLKLTPMSDTDSSYLPYEQKNIEIGTNLTTIHLMNDKPELHGYTDQAAAQKFGVLIMGDVNADGILDEADKDILMDIISGKEETHSVYCDRADLNGDGQVNLLDVSVFAGYYGTGLESRKAHPVENIVIRAGEVTEKAETGTEVTGSLTGAMTGEGSAVALKSAGAAISDTSPVQVSAEFAEPKTMGGFVIDPVEGSDGSIRDGQVVVETEEGTQRVFTVRDGQALQQVSMIRAGFFALNTIAIQDGMLQGMPIVIDLKGQVAVKKITIKVTKTMSGGSLAEISDVEFYGDMADRIPKAPMSVPERVVVENGSECFTLSWKKMPNVTGYEVVVSGTDSKGRTSSDTHKVETAGLEVTSLNGSDLVNGNLYEVEVRSVNGSWRSQAAKVSAAPRAMGLPPAPENLVIQSGYRRLIISWKDMKDTETYNLFYRIASSDNTPYQPVKAIAGTKYELTNLQDETEYEFYLTGVNPIGEGPESLHYTASTISLNPPETPNYKLINTVRTGEAVTAHILSVANGGEGDRQFDIVDGRYDTSWVREDWDAGYTYPDDGKAPVVTFDQEYEMDTVLVIPDEAQTYEMTGATLQYWSADGTKTALKTTMRRKVSSNNKIYYTFQTEQPFKASKVQLLMGNSYGHARRISVAEMKFYYYDPIEHEIMDLYTDSYHVVLREDVTVADINALRAKLKIKDSVSGEYHPRKAELETELDNAEKILKEGAQAQILAVDTKDTARSDSHITFRGGLNTYQPLGVTALAGETVTVYVGGPMVRNGDTTRLELIISQYHGSSNAVFKSLGYLKGGPNEITVTALDDMNLERGGQLYVEYTGASGAEQYGVRVSGGHKAAVLDLSDETDTAKRVELAREYLLEVTAQEEAARTDHAKDHQKYTWQPENCIYQATDILTRYGMISTAVTQVLEGPGRGSADDMARKLEQSMRAFDEMMVLFYQHKGLSEDEKAPSYNKMPVSRINIRYQRMFAGAFMYAGGKHIGIEWPELKGMMGGVPVQTDGNGRYAGTGQYFGWGIAHEIGHEINEGAYAVAEVTNNYFSVLAQAKDTNDSVRFQYGDVFKKVTSGTKGKASNVFVQLAMYWQLHLAYDLGGYNYKTYDDNAEQLANLFFARADSYARHPDAAPGAEGNKLSLSQADTDNKLMRLAVAAAEKNILEFFTRWGLEPDAGTVAYASQFEKETRGIWFANDEIRAYQLENGYGWDRAAGAAVSGNIDYTEGSSQVTLNLSSDSEIWMYEIYRYERVKDGIERRPVGYAEAFAGGNAIFTDVIGTINNHTFTYEVVGYDRCLNPTARTEIGSVKVSHDGRLDNTLWTVSTNLVNDDLEQPNEEHPDTTKQPGIEAMIDGDDATAFTGRTADGSDPEIIIHLNQPETVTGLKYRAGSGPAITDFEISVSETGQDWKTVVTTEKRFQPDAAGSHTVWFHDEKNLYTYDASYVRIRAKGQGHSAVAVAELSLMGQTGDNIDLAPAGSIGILKADFNGANGVHIPAGSIIFTGQYKGNPAFNAVLLWDENGQLVGGTDAQGNVRAVQVIFAPDPKDGLLGEVSSGTWVYYIEPAYAGTVNASRVRAELYRVDNALTNEGERLVSSTLFVDVPAELPQIMLNEGGGLS